MKILNDLIRDKANEIDENKQNKTEENLHDLDFSNTTKSWNEEEMLKLI